MHAANSALKLNKMTPDELAAHPTPSELLLRKAAGEKSPLIFEAFRLDHKGAFKHCFFKR
jgi:hypothetical protein